MEEILQKARELAELIVNSETYRRSRAAEAAAYADPAATGAVAAYYARQQEVQALLGKSDEMDPSALADAARALEEARDAMENNSLVKQMQEANAECNKLLGVVSDVLQQAISGSSSGGCSGSCSTCSGCGSHG